MSFLAFFLFLVLPQFPHYFSLFCVAPPPCCLILFCCVCVFTVVHVTVECCWCFPFRVGWVPFFYYLSGKSVLCVLIHFLFDRASPHRMTFKVDPDTHIDSLEKAEDNVLEGTSHWSCKIATTGQATRVHRHTNKAWRMEV